MTTFVYIATVLGMISAVITIVQFCANGRRNYLGVVAATILIGLLVLSICQNITIQKQDKIIKQKENIAVRANKILESTKFFGEQESATAYVSFLESVREFYPDSYARACKIESQMDNGRYSMLSTDSTISAYVAYKKLYGIVQGIAAMNEDDQ